MQCKMDINDLQLNLYMSIMYIEVIINRSRVDNAVPGCIESYLLGTPKQFGCPKNGGSGVAGSQARMSYHYDSVVYSIRGPMQLEMDPFKWASLPVLFDWSLTGAAQ